MTVRDREKYLFCFIFYEVIKKKIKCNPLSWDKPSHRVKVGLRREGKIRKTKVDKLVFYLFIYWWQSCVACEA